MKLRRSISAMLLAGVFMTCGFHNASAMDVEESSGMTEFDKNVYCALGAGAAAIGSGLVWWLLSRRKGRIKEEIEEFEAEIKRYRKLIEEKPQSRNDLEEVISSLENDIRSRNTSLVRDWWYKGGAAVALLAALTICGKKAFDAHGSFPSFTPPEIKWPKNVVHDPDPFGAEDDREKDWTLPEVTPESMNGVRALCNLGTGDGDSTESGDQEPEGFPTPEQVAQVILDASEAIDEAGGVKEKSDASGDQE